MGEVAKQISKEDLELLAGLASKYNVEVERPKLPILKINYDADSTYPRGEWIVGQTKDENGDIVDEGRPVKEFILLGVYNRYSLYNENDISKNCKSPLHTIGDAGHVKGDNYGYICGAKCPHRASDATPRCTAQKVLFGVAVTQDGAEIDCVAYMKGKSYMAFVDYMKKHPIKVGKVPVPMFAHTIRLSSKKEKNKGTVYYVAEFETGSILTLHKIQEMAKKADGVIKFVETANSNIVTPQTIKAENIADINTKKIDSVDVGDDIDNIPIDVVELDKQNLKNSDPDEDIEAKIAALLEG